MGLVLNLQHYCLHDGPGIRTTVFLKGCPLHCAWCHNPESQSAKPEILLHRSLCAFCGRCEAVCPAGCHEFPEGYAGARPETRLFHPEKCLACGRCAAVCPTRALELSGREMTAEEVLSDVLADKAFYENSGGGMTVSGGEPLYQPAFLLELLTLAKASGLHTAVETSGFGTEEAVRCIAPFTDLFLYDCKLTDEALHRQWTGAGPTISRQNLGLLSELGAAVILRCPLIPGVNDTEEHFRGIRALADACPAIQGIELEPYHDLGLHKAEDLGRPESVRAFRLPTGEKIRGWTERLQSMTKVPVSVNR